MANRFIIDVEEFFRNIDIISTRQIYESTANKYDLSVSITNYVAPRSLALCFAQLLLPKNSKILDIGAGTGAVGLELNGIGYNNLHALDGSRAMLHIANQKGIYRTYTELLLQSMTILPFATGSFDCVLLAGVLAPKHVPIEALAEACRVTRRGGIVAWIQCNSDRYPRMDIQYTNGRFEVFLRQMEEDRLWRPCEGFPLGDQPYMSDISGTVHAYEVIKEDD